MREGGGGQQDLYIIFLKRSQQEDGPWRILADNLLEDSIPFGPYNDVQPFSGIYFYLMMAANTAGVTPYSNIVKTDIKRE
ncbi:hypothetical protein JOC77_001486 [Peribacillus deserti]|uniref:Uncharacterized protein n=1 Tax=Peribacillus deserti TaxID=673318 RepID=A0ABS2QH62_9BACI|nr:hypothetical protein [Peribacillus deserti]MBM7692059.1 hypothetical protein [Peribacillus deserti]